MGKVEEFLKRAAEFEAIVAEAQSDGLRASMSPGNITRDGVMALAAYGSFAIQSSGVQPHRHF